jgi:phage gpG-like protein
MIRITADVLGEVQLDRQFSRLVSGGNDLSPLFEKMGEDIRDIEKEQFDAEGYGWQELSPAYARWKEIHYPGQPILRRTNRLYESMTSKSGADNVSNVQPTFAEFGAAAPSGMYGRFHQLGTVNMPQRKVVQLTEENKRLLTKTFHQYFISLAHDLGFEVV